MHIDAQRPCALVGGCCFGAIVTVFLVGAYSSSVLYQRSDSPQIAETDHIHSWSSLTQQLEELSTQLDQVQRDSLRCHGGWQQDPFIIGGISDSGTRGTFHTVVDLFETAHVPSCYLPGDYLRPECSQEADKCYPGRNHNEDDMVIGMVIDKFWNDRSIGRSFREYGVRTGRNNQILMGKPQLKHVMDALCEGLKRDWECAGRPEGAWMFKIPRTHMLLQFWDILVPEHRYLHTTRDPRGNCEPFANTITFDSVCNSVIGNCAVHRPWSGQSYEQCFQFWAHLNIFGEKFYHENEDRSSRYLQVPMEDLVATAAGTETEAATVRRQHDLFDAFLKLDPTLDPEKSASVARNEAVYAETASEAGMDEKKKSRPAGALDQDSMRTLAWNNMLQKEDFRYTLCMIGYDEHRYGRVQNHNPNGDWKANMARCCEMLGLAFDCGLT